jgi:hypothetical protein
MFGSPAAMRREYRIARRMIATTNKKTDSGILTIAAVIKNQLTSISIENAKDRRCWSHSRIRYDERIEAHQYQQKRMRKAQALVSQRI